MKIPALIFGFIVIILIMGCQPDQGVPGPQGAVGTPGVAGPTGPAGAPAVAPTLGITGAPLSACPNGGVTLTTTTPATCGWGCAPVITSQNICNGTQGMPGATGAAGTNATPVTVVELCPGVSSYPGVFVETALCIDGELYGVYSVPNAFLTGLPNGNYTSTGIGSACNLSINGCTVTH